MSSLNRVSLKYDPNILTSSVVSIDVETTGLSRGDDLYSIAFGFMNGTTIVTFSYILRDSSVQDLKEIEKVLKSTLFNPEFPGVVVFHNASFDLRFILLRFGYLIGLKNRDSISRGMFSSVCDTLALSRIKNSTKFLSHADPKGHRCHSLKYLAKEYGYNFGEDDDFLQTTGNINIRFVDPALLKLYNEDDAAKTVFIYYRILEDFSYEELEFWKAFESEHIWNIIHLTWHGVSIDKPKMDTMMESMDKALEELAINIFRVVGREFNIESPQQLSKVLFRNPRIYYKNSNGHRQSISPFGFGDGGDPKVDLDTLKSIVNRIEKVDSNSNFIPLARHLSRYLEISKNLSKLEIIERYLTREGNDFWVDPNISASTKSGRISCSSPALLGLSKTIFKKGGLSIAEDTNSDLLWHALKNKSVREMIEVRPNYVLARIDISGLDLGVLTWFAKKFNEFFFWTVLFRKYKGKIPDPHFSILQEIAHRAGGKAKELFERAFGRFADLLEGGLQSYFPMKHTDEGIEFIHRISHETTFIKFESTEEKQTLEYIRDCAKQLVLASSYLIGGNSLATNLAKALKNTVLQEESKAILDSFYSVFPEIRNFQDSVGNEIYKYGYVESPFGRRFYADTWGDLNKGVRYNSRAEVHLILEIKGKWYYLRCIDYQQNPETIIENLTISEKPFGLKFANILAVRELDRTIFKLKNSSEDLTSFRRDSEEVDHEFELSRIAITERVNYITSIPHVLSELEWAIKANFLMDGDFLIPEKYVRFFKVELGEPSSKYYKKFTPLLRSIKTYFPMYCQGIANTIAVTCLTQVRQRLEAELPTARILFFIHDEIVLLIPRGVDTEKKAKDILNEAVEDMNSKKPFDVPFTGKFKLLDQFE